METSAQIYVRLVNMRTSAGEILYERLTLAQRLLSDRAWVTAVDCGGGDENIALDRLETEAFGDVCGAVSLVQMLEILRAVPSVKTWKANKFNLSRMYQEMKARQNAGKEEKPREKTIHPEDNKDRKIQELKEEITQLRERLSEITAENKKLKRTLKGIQKQLGMPEEGYAAA